MADQVKPILIQVDHFMYGSSRCSGFQFDNIIVTHGSLLSPLCVCNGENVVDDKSISNSFLKIMVELSKMQYFVNPENYYKGNTTFNFKALTKDESDLKKAITKPIDIYSECDKNKMLSDETGRSEDARLCLIYKYKNGSMASEFFSTGYFESQNSSFTTFDSLIFPVFLFLMTGIPTKHSFQTSLYTLLKTLKETPIHPGLSIAIGSTPFTSLAFYNSLSCGIVSKCMGPDQDGFLIDARLVFGCEGAPIYVFKDGVKGALIGIVICTMLRSDERECIGFSLGLSLKHLFMAVLELKLNDYIPFNKLKVTASPSVLNIDYLSSAVVFVCCQHKGGSGVVIDADLGLVLTCSHIVNHAQDSVYVIFKGRKYPVLVVFSSPPVDPYDLALLSVGKVPGLTSLIMAEKSPVVGESVVTVGYALSTGNSVVANGTPTLSGGCVSKVCGRGGPLQTTCCTQSGMSGGAVLRPPDQLLGIVVCNISLGTAILPFFSFAVSVDDFQSAIKHYINTKDPTCLQSLIVKNHEVKLKWKLVDSKL